MNLTSWLNRMSPVRYKKDIINSSIPKFVPFIENFTSLNKGQPTNVTI